MLMVFDVKDLFDSSTEEMDIESLISAKKGPGRQGKIVNESNFFHVLDYFSKVEFPPVELLDIRRAAPSSHLSGSGIVGQIARYELLINEYEKTPEHLTHQGLGISVSDRIGPLKEQLEHLKSVKKDIPGALISRLQLWVKFNVSSEQWKRCLNLAARRKADRKVIKRSITLDEDVFNQVKRLKSKYGNQGWDEFILEMAQIYEAKKCSEK